MKLIVADAYGTGYRANSDSGSEELSPDSWTEVDVRDRITATDGDVVVRYRDGGREVTVSAGSYYDIEYDNPDVIDVRSPEAGADELIGALRQSPPDTQRVLDVLGALQVDTKIDDLKVTYAQRTGTELEDDLRAGLTDPELGYALQLIGIF